MRFSLRALKRKTLTKLILKSRQARIGQPPKKLQKKPSEDQQPQPQLIGGPEFAAARSVIDAETESVRTDPFPTLSIIDEEEYEPSDHPQTQISREKPINDNIRDCSNTQHLRDYASSEVSSIGEQGLAIYLRRHQNKLDKSLRAQFKAGDHVAAQGDAFEGGTKPGNNTPEKSTPVISDNASSIYSDNESTKFRGVDMEAILDYTAANYQLSPAQIADLNGDMALMRAGLNSEDNVQKMLRVQPEPDNDDKNTSARDTMLSYQTLESSISDNEKQSDEASNIRLEASESSSKQAEISHTPSHRLSASSTNSTKASSTKTRSISSYFTARTSASAPFLESNSAEASDRSSTESSNPSSTSNLVESSSTETLPSPTSLPTGRTTPFLELLTEVNRKRPFTI